MLTDLKMIQSNIIFLFQEKIYLKLYLGRRKLIPCCYKVNIIRERDVTWLKLPFVIIGHISYPALPLALPA